MGQSDFIDRHEETWEHFETLVEDCESGEVEPERIDSFPSLYRTLCRHLALARHRHYSSETIRRLNTLVRRGHALLYGSQPGRWPQIASYLVGGFARDVRRDAHLLGLAALLFVGPLLATLIWLQIDPRWAHHILGAPQISQLQSMYESTDALQKGRRADSDVLMFGYYIYNNIGIAFRTVGSGLIAGIGAFVTLLYNGVVIGATAGYLQHIGLGSNFWSFVIGHSALELTAIVLSGQVALKIGFAPIWPGRSRRLEAVRQAGRESLGLIGGLFAMLLAAAFIEAFWSSAPLPAELKYAVGAILWGAVLSYFVFAGRRT